jgi:DNA sulfur modification protein DndD
MSNTKETTPQAEHYFADFLYKASEKQSDQSELYNDFLKILDDDRTNLVELDKQERKNKILSLIEDYVTEDDYKEKIQDSEITEPTMTAQDAEASKDNIIGKLKIRNFRGFKTNGEDNNREISFQPKANIFYSPNGGGKSSLCEAIEWCLTGSTYEYENRKKPKDYFQHDDTNNPSYEKTTLRNSDGGEFKQNADYYSKCFIEKNRIESFGRLSSQGKDADNMLSTLFGFRPLFDFYDEFVQSDRFEPTDSYLKSNPESNWSEWSDYEDNKESAQQSVNKAEGKIQEILDSLQKECKVTVGDPDIEDISLAEKLEAVEKSSTRLDNRLSVLENHDLKEAQSKLSDVRDTLKRLKDINKELEKIESDVDAYEFYRSAQTLMKDYDDSVCPLCDTPLKGKNITVVTKPKNKIGKELKRLDNIDELKDQKENEKEDLRDFVTNTNQIWRNFRRKIKDNKWLLRYLEFYELGEDLEKDETSDLVDDKIIEDKPETAKKKVDKRIDLLSKSIDNLSQYKNTVSNLSITAWCRNNESKIKEIGNLKAKLENAKNQLEKLDGQDKNAKIANEMLKQYGSFKESFRNYKDDLSENESIHELTSALYRVFNLYDTDAQKVENIQLPETHDDFFTIKFARRNNGGLSSLSEGHLKVLGLSILLARAQKHNLPFIVFDDVVNAIDSDHRNNIARFLSGRLPKSDMKEAFGDNNKLIERTQDFIDDLQLIITTHDRFFDEQISNMFSGDDVNHYVLYYGDEGVIPVDRAANFENKIEYFRNKEVRDLRSALMYARLALEEYLVIKANKGINDCVCDQNGGDNHRNIKFRREINGSTKMLHYVGLNDLLNRVEEAHRDCETAGNDDIAEACEEIKNWDNVPWLKKIIDQEHHYLNRGRFNLEDASVAEMEIGDIVETIKKIKPKL